MEGGGGGGARGGEDVPSTYSIICVIFEHSWINVST